MNSEKPDGTAMHADERRSVGVIALIAMIRMFGLFALLPVLSLYAAELRDATPLLIGLAVGGYGLTQAGFQVPLGALSDRVGRLPVIVGGLLVFAAGSLLAGASDSIYGVIAGRLLQGAGAISATLTALISDATREEVRTRSMAVFGVGIGLSFMIAMVIGPLVAGHFGVRSLFWAAAVLAIVAALMLRLLPEIPPPARRASWSIVPAFRADLLRIDFYVFLLHAIMTATFVALPFLLTDRLGMALTEHWKIYVGALVVSLGIAVPMIMNDHHQGRGRLIGLAVTLIIAAQLALTFFGFSSLPVFLALVMYFAGFNFLEAGLPARLSVLADGEVRGASLGVFSSAQFLGAFVGGLVGGRFLGQGRPADVFFVCALMGGIWLALHGFGNSRRQPN
ncbi:MAG: MFS transporter [Gammaproteobacteria bacterium]|nr:MFS transporter [Gammaproteobacteria bacterium]MDH3820011.1 MFS transporter [Gammaproteobacteria bacterium]MDH4005236.1 MFS transporter [Gammaproteobacteria bacterium]